MGALTESLGLGRTLHSVECGLRAARAALSRVRDLEDLERLTDLRGDVPEEFEGLDTLGCLVAQAVVLEELEHRTGRISKHNKYENGIFQLEDQ